MLTIKCSCGEIITASEEHIGKKVRCKCGCIIDIARPLQQPAPAKQETYSPRPGMSPGKDADFGIARNRKQRQPKRAASIPLWCFLAAMMVFAINRFNAYQVDRDRQEKTQATIKGFDDATKRSAKGLDLKPITLPKDLKPIRLEKTKPLIEDIPPARPAVSLPNGEEIASMGTFDGLGRLTIDNGNTRDAAVKLLSQDGSVERFFYVRARHRATVQHVPSGSYDVLFASGTDWDTEAIDFRRDNSYVKLQTTMEFEETPSEGGTTYGVHTLTLHKTLLGNVHSRGISKAEFERAGLKSVR